MAQAIASDRWVAWRFVRRVHSLSAKRRGTKLGILDRSPKRKVFALRIPFRTAKESSDRDDILGKDATTCNGPQGLKAKG